MAARTQLLLALAGAVVVAELAVVALLPRGVIAPVDVPAGAYFSPAELARAEAFRAPQPWLRALALALQIAVLVVLVRRPPRRGAFLTGALLSLAVTAATLPVGVVSRVRAMEVGLVTRSWPGWAWDVVLGAAIGAAIAGVGALFAVRLMRRFPRGWWAPAAAVVVAFAVALTTLQPVVLDPLFNDFRPVPDRALRADVERLAERAGIEVGEVSVMDASRRTTAANAYVAGLGTTKRVVLYDTLVERFTPAQVRVVVAHELGHVHHADVPKGLLWVALVAPAGMFAAARLTARLGGGLPALALSLALLVPVITAVSNQLSRRVEARADAFALALTGEPRAMIDLERRIALTNVSDPAPPALATALLATHPPIIERIGMAEAARRQGQSPVSGRSRMPSRARHLE